MFRDGAWKGWSGGPGEGTSWKSGITLKPLLQLENENADAYGAIWEFIKDSASPADNDQLGLLRWKGDDSGGNETVFASIEALSLDVTDTTEDGAILFKAMVAGTLSEILRIGGASVGRGLELTDGTDVHLIKAVQEAGLGGRFTIGLDETARTLVICDAGDIDTDFGLINWSQPSVAILDATGANPLYIFHELFYQPNETFTFNAKALDYKTTTFASWTLIEDLVTGNVFRFKSDAGKEVVDTDGEQSWVYIEPKVNQSSTAAFNALKINTTETALGDGSTGSGNNLLLLQVNSASKFRVGMGGEIIGSHDDITATSEGVAASVITDTTFVTTNGDSDLDNVTLADGVEGQIKSICCVVEGNAADTWKVTPANMVGGTQITFAGIGEGCVLRMYSAGWVVVGNNGGTIS